MSRERIALDLASYLDSPHAGRQPGISAAQERGALEQFLQSAYEELGKAPNLLDGQELHELLGHRLPARFGRRDPVVPQVPALIGRYYDHLEETVPLEDAFAIRQALEQTAPEFVAAATSGRAASHGLPPSAPIVNRAPKLGRNDPCWCGSGRKFKKCHGAAG